MNEVVDAGLARLSGARLVELRRAADLQHFTFALTDGAMLALHVLFPWRLLGPSGIVVAAGDYWRPAAADTPEDVYERGTVGARLRDVRNVGVRDVLGADGVSVLATEADALSGLVVHFAGELRLEVFPDASRAAHDKSEFWRLFEQGQAHLVVGSDGAEIHARDV